MTIKPALRGLTSALALNTTDPLGVDVQARGMAAYQAEKATENPNFMSGPLPDPRWEGFFQALADQGVTRVGQDAARPNPGADAVENPQGDVAHASTGDRIDGGPLMQSTSLARPSLRGLMKAQKR